MKDYLFKVFSDDAGRPSSMRILLFFIMAYAMFFSTITLIIWSYICLKTGQFVPLTMGDFPAFFTAIVSLGFKVYQKKWENIPKGENE